MIWTIGHSTHSLDDFLEILSAHRIELVVDVRRFPGSRRLPQFNRATLEQSLAAAGVAYCSLPSLGGRRTPLPDSPNSGWRNSSFRGYADHMASEEFAEGHFELITLAGGLRTAVMCAEVLWWRCHRRLISDLLVSIGVEVLHIRGVGEAEPHRLTPPARMADGTLSYVAEE